MALDPLLLEILACPRCKVAVELEGDPGCRSAATPGVRAPQAQVRLVCVRCGLRYRIEDDIPIMLVEEAEPPAPGWQQKTDR